MGKTTATVTPYQATKVYPYTRSGNAHVLLELADHVERRLMPVVLVVLVQLLRVLVVLRVLRVILCMARGGVQKWSRGQGKNGSGSLWLRERVKKKHAECPLHPLFRIKPSIPAIAKRTKVVRSRLACIIFAISAAEGACARWWMLGFSSSIV